MKLTHSLIAIILLFAMALPAHARGLKFGDDEQIHMLEDVLIQSSTATEELYLGYKTTTKFFGLGVYINDGGYVLGVKGENKYYSLTADQIKKFQSESTLPKPLPPYEISLIDYIFGYSLWILLVGVGLFYLIKSLIGRSRTA